LALRYISESLQRANNCTLILRNGRELNQAT
jgi:hypothetical protein